MEPLTAILSGVGALFNWDAKRREADIKREALLVERHTVEANMRLGLAGIEAAQRLKQIEAELAALEAMERGDTDRTRSYYAFASRRALSGALVAVAGVALVGGAIYLNLRGKS
jgi:hypothetical protein